MAKLFRIRETRPAVQVWEYEVMAESKEQALETVMNGDAEVMNYEIEDAWCDPFEDANYDIQVDGDEDEA